MQSREEQTIVNDFDITAMRHYSQDSIENRATAQPAEPDMFKTASDPIDLPLKKAPTRKNFKKKKTLRMK